MNLVYPKFSVQNCISAGVIHTVGIKADGRQVISTIITETEEDVGQTNVTSIFSNFVAVSAGYKHTVLLDKDRVVYARGSNEFGQCNASKWRDVRTVSAGGYHTIGLRSDGRVVATGANEDDECDTLSWHLKIK